jgi:uncharacterized protein (DUF302 family)
MSDMGQAVTLSGDFESAIERVTEALKGEGFGVLTRIDVDKAFKEKIGVDFRRYAILGACNPNLAHTALSARPEIGLLLPCNVTVEQDGDDIIVRFVDPEMMMSVGELGQLDVIKTLADDAKGRLSRAAAALSEG